MAYKPSIPKGTRDFLPLESAKRKYIFNTIQSVFDLYGYQQIETPALENLSTLMGKYGEEGDKLLFKVLNSGDFLKDVEVSEVEEKDLTSVLKKISEKGLRYDLTVPFARFVVLHRDKIQFPFKRCQIQPVWRADRPQKGRYREFYQCDADVVGSDSLWNEVELLSMIDEVFKKLGINFLIKLNNRKVLSGIADIIGEGDRLTDITVAIDKIEKIGLENVTEELRKKGIGEEAITNLKPILLLSGNNKEKLESLGKILKDSETGMTGVKELKEVVERFDASGHNCGLEIDISLARGLNYYTGTIIEVKAMDVEIGSICGGGRYDNLTGVFGVSGLSGVGISFGADRIYDVMTQLDLFPAKTEEGVEILFVNFGEAEAAKAYEIVKYLRESGVSAELYPDNTKLKKQFGYADSNHIPFIGIIGEDELKENLVTWKDMKTGNQEKNTKEELLERLKSAAL